MYLIASFHNCPRVKRKEGKLVEEHLSGLGTSWVRVIRYEVWETDIVLPVLALSCYAELLDLALDGRQGFSSDREEHKLHGSAVSVY